MIAILAVLAAALAAVLYLLASSQAQRREAQARLEARDREALQLRADLVAQREQRDRELQLLRADHAREVDLVRADLERHLVLAREESARASAAHDRDRQAFAAAQDEARAAVERRLQEAAAEGEKLRQVITAAEAARARAEAELRAERDTHDRLQLTFDALSKKALDANSAHVLQLTEQVLARARDVSRSELDQRAQAVAELVRPMQESLSRVGDNIQKLEKSGEIASAQLTEQMRSLTAAEEKIRDTADRLASALRAPAQRGRWGETQLRRTLDLAGLRPHVDFDEQPVVQSPDGALRPDVAVRLPGGKTVLLDSKVPLEAFLRAVDAAEEDRALHLRAHAAQLRAHIDALSRKQYWEAFAGSPEMAILFLPSDGLLAAALEADPALHEDAFARRIVLATPSTLLGLLLTIAHVWKQENIALNARAIANEGRELHKRVADLSRHLAKLGRALDSVVKTFNGAVGSFDARLLPAARRFEELKAAAVDVQIEAIAELDGAPRLPRVAGEAAADLEEAN